MAKCQCGADLPGRRRKCDECKKRPGKVVVEPPVPAYPAGLRDRGRQLWDGIGQHLDTPAGQLALEACRLADRLDEIDQVIAGKDVLHLMAFRLNYDLGELIDASEERTISIKVEVSGVLTEARQQQNTFRQVLAALAELKVKSAKDPKPATPPADAGSAPQSATTGLNELEERRRRREQEA